MIVAKGNLKGKLNIGKEYVQPTTQQKTVTPTEQIQEILPDINIDALSKVTVNAIPEEYLRPDEVEYLKITKTIQNIEVSCYIYKPSYTSQALTEAERILNSDDMLVLLLFELAQTDASALAGNIENMGVELIEKLLQLSTVVQDYSLASDVSESLRIDKSITISSCSC